jgi:hypothetical protein
MQMQALFSTFFIPATEPQDYAGPLPSAEALYQRAPGSFSG